MPQFKVRIFFNAHDAAPFEHFTTAFRTYQFNFSLKIHLNICYYPYFCILFHRVFSLRWIKKLTMLTYRIGNLFNQFVRSIKN